MAFTATDLANIDNAIASGELIVEVAGRKVTYRSLDDLTKARAIILTQNPELAPAPSVSAGRPAKHFAFITARERR